MTITQHLAIIDAVGVSVTNAAAQYATDAGWDFGAHVDTARLGVSETDIDTLEAMRAEGSTLTADQLHAYCVALVAAATVGRRPEEA